MEKKQTHYETDANELSNQSDLSNAGDTGNIHDSPKTGNEETDAHTLDTPQDDVDVMEQKSLGDNEIPQAPAQNPTGKPPRRRKSSKSARGGEASHTAVTSGEKASGEDASLSGEKNALGDTLVVDQTTTSEEKNTIDDQDEEERFPLPETLPILPLK